METSKINSNDERYYSIIRTLSITPYSQELLIKDTKKNKLYSHLKFKEPNNPLRQLYANEFETLKTQMHPHITQIHKLIFSKTDPNIILFSECYESTLYKTISNRKNTFFSERTIYDWFTQICLGIKHLHDQKIMHRFLNSKIIYFSSNNRIKIGGFGNMKVLPSQKDKAITCVGEDLYIAPEILLNKPYSFKADIWSLGVILFFLMKLELPFNDVGMSNILLLKKTDKNALHRKLPKHYSSNLKSLVEQMLEGDPIKRPTINQILLLDPIKRTLNKFIIEQRENSIYCQNILNSSSGIIKEKLKTKPDVSKDKQTSKEKSNKGSILEIVDNINNKIDFNEMCKSLKPGDKLERDSENNTMSVKKKDIKLCDNVQKGYNTISNKESFVKTFSEYKKRRENLVNNLGEEGIINMFKVMKGLYFDEQNQRKPVILPKERNKELIKGLKALDYNSEELEIFVENADEMEKLIIEKKEYFNSTVPIEK